MVDASAAVQSAVHDVQAAAASVGQTVDGAASEWVRHIKSLWVKRMGWAIAVAAAFVLGTMVGHIF